MTTNPFLVACRPTTRSLLERSVCTSSYRCSVLYTAQLASRAGAATLLPILVRRAQAVRLDQRAELACVLAKVVAVAARSVAAATRSRHLDERQGTPGGRCRARRPLALHPRAGPRLVRRAFRGGGEAAAEPLAAGGPPPF
jgi:hypothetical protein